MVTQNKKAEIVFFDTVNSGSPWLTFNVAGQKHLMDLFASLVHPQKDNVTLDMGCGTGDFSMALNALGLKVKGVDISQKSIDYCKHKYGSEFHFEQGDIESLSDKEESIDILFFGGILHHFPQREKVFQEAHRVLKKGGKIFAFDPHYYSPVIWFYREFLGVKTQKTENEVLLKSTVITDELKKAGFTQIQVESTANMTFSVDYFKTLLPFPLYYAAYGYNLLEKFLYIFPPIRKKLGSFLITYAEK